MARHKKQHHRKVKQERFNGQLPPVVAPVETIADSPAVAAISQEAQYVKKDLLVTLYTVVALLAILIVAALLNNQYQWTTNFGIDLYRLLNIR